MVSVLNLYETSTLSIWKQTFIKDSLQSPFQSYHWHKLWFETLGKDWQPLILFINNQIIASFARKDTQIIFSGGDEITDYNDLIGEEKEKFSAWEELLVFFKKNNITDINLKNIPCKSSTIKFFASNKELKIKEEDSTPIVYLPSTWDQYKLNLIKKDRHELERKLRKFERENENIKISLSPNLNEDIEDLFRLMKLNPFKDKFLTDQMQLVFREIIRLFKDQIRMKILKVNEEKVAALLYFEFENKAYLYNTGFNEEKVSGSGFYLHARNIQDAIDNKISEYNFLQGRERYKYNLGANDFLVFSLIS